MAQNIEVCSPLGPTFVTFLSLLYTFILVFTKVLLPACGTKKGKVLMDEKMRIRSKWSFFIIMACHLSHSILTAFNPK